MVGNESMKNRVVVVSGPPGAGKSTVASLVAPRLGAPSACIEADWFWTTIRTGFIPPWEPASESQNRTILRSVAFAAAEMTASGYHVVIEGVVGPWHLPELVDVFVARDIEATYAVLRPDLNTCLARATSRSEESPRVPGHPPLTDSGPIRHMWEQFANLESYESHALDTTDLTTADTADHVITAIDEGKLRLPTST